MPYSTLPLFPVWRFEKNCTRYFFYSDFSKIVFNDLQTITPEQYFKHVHDRRLAEIRAVSVRCNAQAIQWEI